MRCLDSDILVGILRNNEDAVKKARQIDEEGGAFTTSVNAFEIFIGARISSAKERNLEEAHKLIAKLNVIDFDKDSADKASEILESLKKTGNIIDLKDILVAAISIRNGCTIITRNAKDFSRIKGMNIEKW